MLYWAIKFVAQGFHWNIMGYFDLHCAGDADIRTKHIDITCQVIQDNVNNGANNFKFVRTVDNKVILKKM
jgi:hypothetical protein